MSFFINMSLILKIHLLVRPLVSTIIPDLNNFRFTKNWKNELKYQKEQSNTTFFPKDRGYNRILIIDVIFPNIDKHAWYRCTFMYLAFFKDIGLQVTFLSDNLEKMEPYTTILQQKGIEVLYWDWYKEI